MFTIVASITTSSCASPTLPRIHQRRADPATAPDDQYQVRTWTPWYRHITLSMLARAAGPAAWHHANDPANGRPAKPAQR